MDILGLVKTDQLFAYELRHPVTDEKLNITLHLRSSKSPEVKSVERQNQDELNVLIQRGKPIKSAVLETHAERKAAAMIDSWDWSNKDLDLEGVKAPACTDQNKMLLVAVDSFFDQITDAAATLGNFTPKPPKP